MQKAAGGLFIWAVLILGLHPAAAEDFPPISEEEWALTEVPWAPEAKAVRLLRSAEMWLQGNQRVSTMLRIRERLKILHADGVERHGKVVIWHSRWSRLSGFRGRTVLPDGRVVEVDREAIFQRTASRNDKRFVTSVAFPNVAPGAILDWTYDLSWSSSLYLHPWLFQHREPVLLSEITFHIPKTLAMRPWGVALPGQGFQQEIHPERNGRRLRLWLEKLPPLPDEPFSVPWEDLSARFMLVPKAWGYVSDSRAMLETWSDVCRGVGESYLRMRRRSSVQGQIEDIAQAAREEGGQDVRSVADALYRTVRDFRTVRSFHVFPAKDSLEEVLEDQEGNSADKALLLQALLEKAGISADLVWVPSRRDGAIDPEVPNFAWFEKVLVRTHLSGASGAKSELQSDSQTVLLDPTDSRLGFGALNPDNEGVPALVHHPKKPERIVIPTTPADRSRRQVQAQLRVDEEGRVTGTMELELTGHQAWRRIPWAEDLDESEDSWEEWLRDRWDGYKLDDLQVEEDREKRRVRVQWSLRQRDEMVLGDEVALQLSRPLGPEIQRFHLAPEERRTPVLLGFPRTDEIEVTVSWPTGWEVGVAPHSGRVENLAGVAEARVQVDRETRTLTYHRTLKIADRYFEPPEAYKALRDLYEVMVRSDAEALVLVGP